MHTATSKKMSFLAHIGKKFPLKRTVVLKGNVCIYKGSSASVNVWRRELWIEPHEL